MLPTIKVADISVGWFADGWLYKGPWPNGVPVASFTSDGALVANNLAQRCLGALTENGSIWITVEGRPTVVGRVQRLDEMETDLAVAVRNDGAAICEARCEDPTRAAAAWAIYQAVPSDRAVGRITTVAPNLGALSASSGIGEDGSWRGSCTGDLQPSESGTSAVSTPSYDVVTLASLVSNRQAATFAKPRPRDAKRLRVGDVVEVNRFATHGRGVLREISRDPLRGGGTRLFPAFWVELDDGTADWFGRGSLWFVSRRRGKLL
ncbi:hypothetical protein [Knoellia koreensis]|uniref:Uncharacterized protein n=1 Tax=Knoellia koreensis TaxID=2730921 RepID=A0A849HEJ4_9MICO|nr:hypothetical protein [Knoellia sp. DB2414S]NNM44631.1 hypothetical protein [Knoellia sp. DB2414S]